MLVVEMIRRGALQFSDNGAVVFGDEEMTFREVDLLSNRLANVLMKDAGIAPRSRVGLLLNNSLHSIPLDFALAKAQIARVPLNSRLAAAEHQLMLETAGVELLIYDSALAARANELAESMAHLRILCLQDQAGVAGLLAMSVAASDRPPGLSIGPDDVVLALYTSGTTGTLKAAQHTQATLAAIANNTLCNLIDVQAGESMLHAASLIHASGMFVLPYWVRGGTAYVLPAFAPEQYLETIARRRPTAINLVPTMLGMLLERPGIESADLSSVKTIVYGASPMPRATMERALELWGPRFVQYYGQTEAPLSITVLRKEDHVGPGSYERLLACGQPSVDCEVRLLDDDDREVAPGESGEIVVRAPFGMIGYLDAPEINARTMLP
ncbi:MAG: AMP-binding protein, partial [Candidatus Eremiobacteraeota bacterium]|nr:AMP-binding protein [Candidatus Eremiobacteraeota bacterium]